MATVNVTVNMTPEMLADIDESAESHEMSRAQWIRHCIRQAEDSPFDTPEQTLREESESTEKGAA